MGVARGTVASVGKEVHGVWEAMKADRRDAKGAVQPTVPVDTEGLLVRPSRSATGASSSSLIPAVGKCTASTKAASPLHHRRRRRRRHLPIGTILTILTILTTLIVHTATIRTTLTTLTAIHRMGTIRAIGAGDASWKSCRCQTRDASRKSRRQMRSV